MGNGIRSTHSEMPSGIFGVTKAGSDEDRISWGRTLDRSRQVEEPERGGGDSVRADSSHEVAPLGCCESFHREVAVVDAERGDEELVAEENEDE